MSGFKLQTVNSREEDRLACQQNAKCFRKGITSFEAVANYSVWADNQKYEEDLKPGRYNGPMIAARAVAEFFPTDRKEKIMDVAAGTGFVGENLANLGFCHIDALEPSSRMCVKAQEKGVYENFYTELLCEDPLPISENTYDCAVVCGGMGKGHIPCSGVKELIRITKPGGLICIVMREEYLYDVDEYRDRLEPLMFSLEMAGKWRRISRVTVPYYFIDYTGALFKYTVL